MTSPIWALPAEPACPRADRRHRSRWRHRQPCRHEAGRRWRRGADTQLHHQPVPGRPSLFDAGMAESPAGDSASAPFRRCDRLPAEDALALSGSRAEKRRRPRPRRGAVLPHISNFDDLDPLEVTSNGVKPGKLFGDTSLVLPGSRRRSFACARRGSTGRRPCRRGGFVLGFCGGYQMQAIRSASAGHGGAPGKVAGLGL